MQSAHDAKVRQEMAEITEYIANQGRNLLQSGLRS